MNTNFDTTDCAPFVAKPTADYGTPRWPFRSPLPSLDEAGKTPLEERLLDLAANCLARTDDRASLRESDDHVVALLRLVERMDVQSGAKDDRIRELERSLAVAQGLAQATRTALETERERHRETANQLEGALVQLQTEQAMHDQSARRADAALEQLRKLKEYSELRDEAYRLLMQRIEDEDGDHVVVGHGGVQ